MMSPWIRHSLELIHLQTHGSVLLIFSLPSPDLTHLKQARDEVVEVANWFSFGIALGLPYHTLQKISRDCRGGTDECMHHMLAEWLQGNYDTHRHGAPTWKNLVKALASPSVRLLRVACHIAEHHSHPRAVVAL